jgi:hypothetical protein
MGEAAELNSTCVYDSAAIRFQGHTPALSSALSEAKVAEIFSRLKAVEMKRRDSELRNTSRPHSIFDSPDEVAAYVQGEPAGCREAKDLAVEESEVLSSSPGDEARPLRSENRLKLVHFLQ